MKNNSVAFVSSTFLEERPPPSNRRGLFGWLRENVFSTPTNILLTLLACAALLWLFASITPWFANAVWNAGSLKQCREVIAANAGPDATGACFAVLKERWHQFIFGFYPAEQYWRPVLAFVLLLPATAPLLFARANKKLLWFTALYPFAAVWLLWGGTIGPASLSEVASDKFGGFLLSLIIGVTAIFFSLPLGLLLALGRQSKLPILKMVCVVFIEFIRGVPLITLLFTASLLLQYFLPKGSNIDLVLRVCVLVTLFSAAYIAEIIRGALVALPRGQYEAASALGLKYWAANYLIILPQALKISIPGIVSSFIDLFKDTTLVIFVGLMDPLSGITKVVRSDGNWKGIYWEPYLFVGAIFFFLCYGMSRYATYLENSLKTDHR